ncbi:hypothetical protein TRVL_01808 [Trypanosoma vivax]|uniref:FCP1 homology domain-containing protein n=1 Tax=Trypanosoma vivax (strain Y486) TaxID=1055687 RepID=G0U4G7_TRYVY|nr:hypothetical protein TRVL_01808 [Trypanosoma vivax]CCC52331.1 conserved hypothetical protein [Trypanosoma vivax Y486]
MAHRDFGVPRGNINFGVDNKREMGFVQTDNARGQRGSSRGQQVEPSGWGNITLNQLACNQSCSKLQNVGQSDFSYCYHYHHHCHHHHYHNHHCQLPQPPPPNEQHANQLHQHGFPSMETNWTRSHMPKTEGDLCSSVTTRMSYQCRGPQETSWCPSQYHPGSRLPFESTRTQITVGDVGQFSQSDVEKQSFAPCVSEKGRGDTFYKCHGTEWGMHYDIHNSKPAPVPLEATCNSNTAPGFSPGGLSQFSPKKQKSPRVPVIMGLVTDNVGKGSCCSDITNKVRVSSPTTRSIVVGHLSESASPALNKHENASTAGNKGDKQVLERDECAQRGTFPSSISSDTCGARGADTQVGVGEVERGRGVRALLPLQLPHHVGRVTCCLDLDDTLVHTFEERPHWWDCSNSRHLEIEIEVGDPFDSDEGSFSTLIVGQSGASTHPPNVSHSLPPPGNNRSLPGTRGVEMQNIGIEKPTRTRERLYVCIRPYAVELLQFCFENVEVVFFTTGTEQYAKQIFDYLDPQQCAHRLYRQHCTQVGERSYKKDLSLLGRPLQRVILVDDRGPEASFQSDNVLFCEPFIIEEVDDCHDRDKNDDDLLSYLKLLQTLARLPSEVMLRAMRDYQQIIESRMNTEMGRLLGT